MDDMDDDDDKPLVFKRHGSSASRQSQLKAEGKRLPPSSQNVSGQSLNGQRDKSPFTSSSKVPISTKPNHFSEKKPLSSRSQQNGSTSSEKKEPNKRPMEKSNTMDQSSAKKPKLSAPSTTTKVEPPASKADESMSDDDDVPVSQRIKKSAIAERKQASASKATKVVSSSFKKANIKNKEQVKTSKYSTSTKIQPSSTDGQKKWTTLVHNGVIFPPPYQPHGVKMHYKGKPVDLTPEQEEVATMFAVMKDTDYMQKPKFLENFWNDWRKILGKNHVIQKLDDCDFTPIYDWHQQEKEKKKQMSTDEKKAIKEQKLKQEEKYMWAIVDGVKEKVGNFRVEPPGLFRGRGEHPKMGKLKRRIRPKDITINIGKDAPIPECPIEGESWNEIKHDNTVTWLAFWNDPINPKEFKYVFLAASSSLKGQSDKEKYEKARKLKDYIRSIRTAYTRDFTSKDVTKRQIAVATYLIDKLALRAGNEKDDDEADTVGCCTLKKSNVECVPPNSLKFDFLGKDSIRYVNEVEVELPVFRAIGQFQTGKNDADLLFDHLDTSKLNAHLKELMPGLTAKVFRTYNASITLDEQVAIICNHQRTVSKSHDSQMMRLTERIDTAKKEVEELKIDLERSRKGKPPLKGADGKQKRNLNPEAIEKKIASAKQKIEKYEMDMKTKEDLKTVALGTSKINYLDPRITVAWCKRHEVPIEKIFNKSLLAKFAWAMDVDPQFRF
ncbi:DNA topoisomerase 1 beta [Linum perenne]